jgi:hypothetical protein
MEGLFPKLGETGCATTRPAKAALDPLRTSAHSERSYWPLRCARISDVYSNRGEAFLELDPTRPDLIFLAEPELKYRVFSEYGADQFTTDSSFRRFVWNALPERVNPIESHAFLFEPVLTNEGGERSGLAPQVLCDLGLAHLGLDWIDGPAVLEHFAPLSYFHEKEFAQAFTGPVLCDPYYGFVIFREDERWRNLPFVLDWLPKRARVVGEGISFFLKNPTNILNIGVLGARYLFAGLLDSSALSVASKFEIPDIIVRSTDELRQWEAATRSASSVIKDVGVWFRGQPREYMIVDRSQAVRNGYLPHSDIQDPSIVPSLFRNVAPLKEGKESYSRYLKDIFSWYEAARRVFGEDFEAVPLHTPARTETHLEEGEIEFSSDHVFLDADGNEVGGYTEHTYFNRSFWARNLLLQHYGAPTPYIDVTSSVEVSQFFAMNRFVRSTDGFGYEPFTWSSQDPRQWPTIYCFVVDRRCDPIAKSADLDVANLSLRAARQSCGLLGGGGLLARNYAARFVALRFRLHPEFFNASKLSARELFPDSSEDRVYSELRKHGGIGEDNSFPLYGFE